MREEAGHLNSKPLVEECCSAMSEATVSYPGSPNIKATLIDWFDLNAADAQDFGVISEPNWHGYSDIRGMQMEGYVARVLREPFIAALSVLRRRGLLTEQALEILNREGL